jgi:hypothetical protein
MFIRPQVLSTAALNEYFNVDEIEIIFPSNPVITMVPYGANIGRFLSGLAMSLDAVHTFIRAVLAESLPLTATEMLPEWHEALGQRYDPTQTMDYQRRMLDAILTAFGGVTLNNLNAQMHKEMADVDILERVSAGTSSIAGEAECGVDECASVVATTEIDPYNYTISGTVQNDAEAARVASVIAHFAPLHLVPFSVLVILSDTGTTEAGLDICGIAECGYAA